jgi:Macrocin-O-methyltransferase (TylF)
LRNRLKDLAGAVSVETWERLLAYSIVREKFASVSRAVILETREQLWEKCLNECVGGNVPMTYVEYGVHEGYSIAYFASKNSSAESAFFGLDSFEGLPEAWGSASMPKGSFGLGGTVPSVRDGRVRFVKGWFQNTSEQLLRSVNEKGAQQLVVHYDADLYSSTLFALSQIASLRRPYYAIFDEFIGHETRALYNFVQAFNVDVQFLAQTLWKGSYPQQVLCKISPAA